MSESGSSTLSADPHTPAAAITARWKRVAVELFALLVVVASAAIILGQWAGTIWEVNLLYSGDSLVLPLLRESVLAGEPFEWVFSSQLFLFPEAPIYFIVNSFTTDPRFGLAAMVVVNLVLLYVLLRWSSRLLFRHSRHRVLEISVALGATAIYVVYVLLEPISDINRTAIASLYLLVSYYPGVIISGLTSIALILWITRAFTGPPLLQPRTAVFGALFVVVGALTGASNPLFWMQVLAPLAVTLLVLFALRRLHPTWFLTLIGAIGVTAATGYVLRLFLERYTSSDVDSYIDWDLAGEAWLLIRTLTTDLASTPQGFLKLVLASSVLLISALPIVRVMLRRTLPDRWHVTTVELFLALFSWVSVASLIGGMVVTGTMTTRYLVPIFVFPLLSASYEAVKFFRTSLALVRDGRRRQSVVTFGLALAAGGAVLILIAGAIALPRATAMVTSKGGGAECSAELPQTAESGVAVFWAARTWDLYGSHDERILQVNPDLTVFPWMINLASYDDQDFNFVLVDPWGYITEESLEWLGPPANIIDCADYVIYDYAGTDGERLLDQWVEDSSQDEQRRHGFD